MATGTDRPLDGKRAAMPIGPMFEDVEATYPLYRLREAGAHVTIVGVAANEEIKGKKGQELRTDMAAADASADTFDILILPGGYGPDRLRTDPGVPGRRVTSWPSIADDLINAGAVWEDAEVVVDNNLVSSRKPDDLPAFMRALIGVAAGPAIRLEPVVAAGLQAG